MRRLIPGNSSINLGRGQGFQQFVDFGQRGSPKAMQGGRGRGASGTPWSPQVDTGDTQEPSRNTPNFFSHSQACQVQCDMPLFVSPSGAAGIQSLGLANRAARARAAVSPEIVLGAQCFEHKSGKTMLDMINV